MNGTTNNHHNHNNNCTNTPSTATTTGATRVDMDDDDDLRIVREPYIHVTSTKGKEIRAILIDAFNHSWLKVPQKEIGVIKGIIDKLHNASLLIDDIEDNSRLRRGQPCAHLIYGIPATINSANYMYFEALKDCHSLNSQQVIDTYMNELLLLHRGQAMDIHWRDNSICPTEEQYLQMVKNKTGGLFRLSVGIMQALSKQNRQTDYTKLVNDLAVLFQILDDYLNLQSDIYQENKSFCEDLTEGKFSFPIIHGINHDTHRQLLNIVRQRSNDDNLKKYALQLMEKSQSFDYTIQVLKQYESEVRREIEKLGGNDDLLKIVDYLMSQTKKVKKQEL